MSITKLQNKIPKHPNRTTNQNPNPQTKQIAQAKQQNNTTKK